MLFVKLTLNLIDVFKMSIYLIETKTSSPNLTDSKNIIKPYWV